MKNIVKAGDFIEITKRKVSDKVQPHFKVGNLYHVNSVDRLKSGAVVLVIDKDPDHHCTLRCNAERFEWRLVTEAEVLEKNFKAECAASTEALRTNFSFEEQMKIAFVPLLITDIAWLWADKAVQYCAEHRIDAVKKLSRTVRYLHTKYSNFIERDLDARHVSMIKDHSDGFVEHHATDFTILFHTVNNSINRQNIGVDHAELRTYAYLSILFAFECRAYEKKVNSFIRTRLKVESEGHLPCLEDLCGLMYAYLGDAKVVADANIKAGMRIFRKNLDNVEFNIKED